MFIILNKSILQYIYVIPYTLSNRLPILNDRQICTFKG